MSKEDLPSIEQFIFNGNLPSVEEFLTEESEQELPSVEDFIEKEEEKIQELIEEFAPENKSLELNEVLRLINDVRESIPDIPEIKYYDKELEDICESIQILASSIPEIPEIKYYDSDIERLQKNIQEVRSEIPIFPKWVNEVNEVPDFSWIGKTFSVIDDDFIKVNDTIETLRERVEINIKEVVEENETKHFETKIILENEIKNLDEKYQQVKDSIWKELRDASLKIWEYHKEFKDDDRKLKKQITNEYNFLKNNLEEKLKEFNENSIKTDQVLLTYFEQLKEEISNLPEVKCYDDDIKDVRKDIKDLYDLVKIIKLEQKDLQELQESVLREPPEEKESIGAAPDPLTPMDQKFATLDDLAEHYRIFINRIQTQLSTMGGGGAGFIKDLDDVSFDQTTGDGKLLIYNQSNSKWVGIASTAFGGSTTLIGLSDVNSSNLGDGRFLRYDASSSEFTFSPVSATNLELIAGDIQSGILTTSSIGESVVMSVSASTYRSVNYQIQVTEGSNYNMTTINVIHDNTNTYMTEYGTINYPVGIATFSTDISGGSLRLLGYPNSSNNTTFKVIFTAIEV
jgi:hypothetical protein